MTIIPNTSPVHQTLSEIAKNSRIVIFSGLPGIGKSLYINDFHSIAESLNKSVTVVQWDKARKGFELPEILERFPLGDGTIHNGTKLLAGKFLLMTIKNWVSIAQQNDILLIEAPLVGHRFIELVEKSEDQQLENHLSNENCKVIVPIPSEDVRKKIEEERAKQIDDNAKVWIGAKPSVMKMLWKMVYNIAIELGLDRAKDNDPAYDPKVVEYVFSKVCRHRHFIPLHINEVFTVPEQSEDELHALQSLAPDPILAKAIFDMVSKEYPDDNIINEKVATWYKQ